MSIGVGSDLQVQGELEKYLHDQGQGTNGGGAQFLGGVSLHTGIPR